MLSSLLTACRRTSPGERSGAGHTRTRRNREVPTFVGELGAVPGAQNDVERFVEDGSRLVDGDAEHAVLRELVASPHPDVDAPRGDMVEQGHALDEAQRVREGQVDDGGPDPHATGARRQVARQQECISGQAIGREVLLGNPDIVEAEGLGKLGAFELLADDVLCAPPGRALENMVGPEAHGGFPTPLPVARPSAD